MQNLILQTKENRIILRDSENDHPFQLERMISFTGNILSGEEEPSPHLIYTGHFPETAPIIKEWVNGELAFDRSSLTFYLKIYKKELLQNRFQSLAASWRMGISAAVTAAMLRGADIMLIHGTLLDTPKGGLLFCGQGGVGKSTTSCRWREAGGSTPADDMLLLEFSGNEVAAHALPTWSRCRESIEGEYFPFRKRIVLKQIFALGRDPEKENIRIIPEWQYFMCIFNACNLFNFYMTSLLPEPEQKRMLEIIRSVSTRLSANFPHTGMFANLNADITQTLKDYL